MRRGALLVVLAASLLTASCMSTQYASGGANDCRSAENPSECFRARREAVEAEEARRIRYEREHRAIDRPRTDPAGDVVNFSSST